MWPHSANYSFERPDGGFSKRNHAAAPNYATFRLNESQGQEDNSLAQNVPGQGQSHEAKEETTKVPSLIFATTCSLVSGFLFAASSYLAKRLEEYPSGTLTSFLMLFYVVVGIPMSIVYWDGLIKDPKKLLGNYLPVCVAVNVSTYLWLMSMRRLSLFDANVIIVSYPIFATILSRIVLKEACSVLQVSAIFMTCVGLCLLTKLPWLASDPSSVALTIDGQGLGVAFGCTASYVLVVILSRRNLQGVHYGANQVWVAILGSPLTILLVLLVDEEPRMPYCGIESIAITLLMIIFFIGSFLLSVSLQQGEVGLVSVVRSAADVLFTFFFQTVVISEPPDVLSIIGGIFVLSSVVLYGLKPPLLNYIRKSETLRKYEFLF